MAKESHAPTSSQTEPVAEFDHSPMFLRKIDETSELRAMRVEGVRTLLVKGKGLNSAATLTVMDHIAGSGTATETLPLANIKSLTAEQGLGDSQGEVQVTHPTLIARMFDERGIWAYLTIHGTKTNSLFVAYGGEVTVIDHEVLHQYAPFALRSIEVENSSQLIFRGMNFTGMHRAVIMDRSDGLGKNEFVTLKGVADTTDQPHFGNTTARATITQRSLIAHLNNPRGVWIKLICGQDYETNILHVAKGGPVQVSGTIEEPGSDPDWAKQSLRFVLSKGKKGRLQLRGLHFEGDTRAIISENADGSGVQEVVPLSKIRHTSDQNPWGNTKADAAISQPELLVRLYDERGIFIRILYDGFTSNQLFLAKGGRATIGDQQPDPSLADQTLRMVAFESQGKLKIWGLNFHGMAEAHVMDRPDGSGQTEIRTIIGVMDEDSDPELGNTSALIMVNHPEIQARMQDDRGVWIKIQMGGFFSNTLFLANAGVAKLNDPIRKVHLIPIALRAATIIDDLDYNVELTGIDFTGIDRALVMDRPEGDGISASYTLRDLQPLSHEPPDLYLGNRTARIHVNHSLLRSRLLDDRGVWIKVKMGEHWTNTVFLNRAGPGQADDLNPSFAPGLVGLGKASFTTPQNLSLIGLDFNSHSRLIVMDAPNADARAISYPLLNIEDFTEEPQLGNRKADVVVKDPDFIARLKDERGVWLQVVTHLSPSNILHIKSGGSASEPNQSVGGLGYVEVSGNQLIIRGTDFEPGMQIVLATDPYGENFIVITIDEVLSYTADPSQGNSQFVITIDDPDLLAAMQGETGVYVKVIAEGVPTNPLHVNNGGSASGPDQTPPPPPDDTPPMVTVSAPSQETLNDRVTITATAQDSESGIQSFTARNSLFPGTDFGLIFDAATSRYTAEIMLNVGENQIIVEATNGAGLTASAAVTVVRHATPTLHITSPAQQTVLTEPQVTIKGQIVTSLPASAFVVTGGTVSAIPSSGSSSGVLEFILLDVPLDEGANTIRIDAVSNLITVTSYLVVGYQPKQDYPAPEITVLSPASGTLLDETLITLQGTVKSHAGPASLMINGQAASLQGAPSLASFSELLTIPAGSEAFTVTLVATDDQPKSTSLSVVYFYDGEAPQITVNGGWQPSPQVNIVDDQQIQFSGTVSDRNFEALTVNGQPVTVEVLGNHSFGFSFPVVIPVGQDVNVTLEAKDILGHTSSATYLFRLNIPLDYLVLQPREGLELTTNGQPISQVVSVELLSLPPGYTLHARHVFGGEQRSSIQLFADDGLARGVISISPETGMHEVLIDVQDPAGLVADRTSRVISVHNMATEELTLSSIHPEPQSLHVEPHQFLTLNFNKPIQPELFAIKVFETVNGRTWVKPDESGREFFQKVGYELQEVNRDHAPVAGRLRFLNDDKAVVFYPERHWSYGAEIFVELSYDQTELRRYMLQTRSLPTFVEGTIGDQFNQNLEGVTVAIPQLGVTTQTKSGGVYSFQDEADKPFATGRYELIYNSDQTMEGLAIHRKIVSLERGVRNRLGHHILPQLNRQIPLLRLTSGQSSASLDQGRLVLNLSSAQLLFPDQRTDGTVHVQLLPAQKISRPLAPVVVPHWLYELQPGGIEVSGHLSIEISMPPLHGAYDYLPPEGYYVTLLGMDHQSGSIVPVGVGQVSKRRVVSVGPLRLNRLDYLGYSLLSYPSQEILQKVAQGTLDLSQLLAELTAIYQ